MMSDPILLALSQGEILGTIFLHLPVPSLLSCSLVSSSWTNEAMKQLEKKSLIRLDFTKLLHYKELIALKAARLGQHTPRPHKMISFTLGGNPISDLTNEESNDLITVLTFLSPNIKRLSLEMLYQGRYCVRIISPETCSMILPLLPDIQELQIKLDSKRKISRQKIPPLSKIQTSLPPADLWNLPRLEAVSLALDAYYENAPKSHVKAFAKRIISLSPNITKLSITKPDPEKSNLLQNSVDDPNLARILSSNFDLIPFVLEEMGENHQIQNVQVCTTTTARYLMQGGGGGGGFPWLTKLQMELDNANIDALKVLTNFGHQLKHLTISLNSGARKEVLIPTMERLKTFELWTSPAIAGCRFHTIQLSQDKDAYPMLEDIFILSNNVFTLHQHFQNLFHVQIIRTAPTPRGQSRSQSQGQSRGQSQSRDRIESAPSPSFLTPLPSLSRILISIPWTEIEKNQPEIYTELRLPFKNSPTRVKYDFKPYHSSGFGTKF